MLLRPLNREQNVQQKQQTNKAKLGGQITTDNVINELSVVIDVSTEGIN